MRFVTPEDIAKEIARNAKQAATKFVEQKTMELQAQGLSNSKIKDFFTKHSKITTLVDEEYKIRVALSGSERIEKIHSLLLDLIDEIAQITQTGSLEIRWAVTNCAEFRALNEYMLEMQRLGRPIDFTKLRFQTYTSDLNKIVSPCQNCDYVFGRLGIPH